MANPFLFMEEEVPTNNDAFQNPFLVEDDDDEETNDFPSENPFSASNPFAFNDTENDSGIANNADSSGANFFLAEDDDDDEEMQQQQHVDPTMSFFGTTINENDIENDEEMKTLPPNRPHPATQQMISNLTDHLDQTSENLLGKIPVTRSPSPVSMRDLHTPSPTPDVDDLLDVSDAFAAAAQQQQNNGFVNNEEIKPNRPPPPRPIPPRPTPPKTASTPVQPTNTTTITQSHTPHQEDDLFDVYGTGHQQKKPPPKPPAPKTKEDILSLFQAPTQQPSSDDTKKPDLLSDDLDFTVQQNEQQPPPPSNVAVVQPYVNENPEIPQAIVEPIVQATPVENHLPTTPMNQIVPTITEDLAEDRPQSDFMDPPEEPDQIKPEVSPDQSPTESGITSGGIPASNSGSVLNMNIQEMEVDPPQQEDSNPFADKTPTPQHEQLQFLTQKSNEYQYQRPTTPDPIVSRPEFAPIFNVDPIPQPTQPVAAVTSPIRPAKPPPPPVRGGSVLTTIQQPVSVQQQSYTSPVVPEIHQADEFDDFAAKFESTNAVKSTGNAFLDSLGVSATENSADAWGDSGSSNAFGDSGVVGDGFGADDGFDSWNVPAAPESTPYAQRKMSSESNENISVTIRPKGDYDIGNVTAPALAAPPQRSPYSQGSAYSEGK